MFAGVALALAAAPLAAQVELDVAPGVVLPVGSATIDYGVGFGAGVNGRYSPDALPLYAGAGLGVGILPTQAETTVTVVDAGLSGGLAIRLGEWDGPVVHAGARLGGYVSLYRGAVGGNPHGQLGAGLRFRIAPGFELGADAGYGYYADFAPDGSLAPPLFQGVQLSLQASWSPGVAASRTIEPQLEIGPPRFDRVFPVLYRYYDEQPLGEVEIINAEDRTIRDVAVEFFVPQYMAAPKRVAEFEELSSGQRVGVPLLALFTEDVLDITESTSVQAQVLTSYDLGESRLTAVRTETLAIQNRNQMTWDDDRKAAAFVASGDPTVQRLSRNITALTRNLESGALNERMRSAVAIHETLRLYGVEYVIDPDSSYIELSANENAIDYLQFPSQTLDFRAGDCDDLSILYASLMEAIGIPTAFVTIPGHIFMAFDLGMDETEARRTFASADDFIFHEGTTWVPVETTMRREGFLQAWATGARQYREAARTQSLGFHPVREAWGRYPPTGFASRALPVSFPAEGEITAAYRSSIRALVSREIAPQVESIQDRLAQRESPRLRNRLGTLYARYGLYEQALAAFGEASADRPYPPALHNTANIHFIRGEYERALALYEEVLDLEPDEPRALVGAARSHFELEQYEAATRRYRDANVIAPEIAAPFAYVVNETTETGRASAAANRTRVQWEEE
jgi:tetratricopeptide (TPR) repeat protein